MIGALAADIFHQRFAELLENAILIGLKRRLAALGCMEHDTDGFRTVDAFGLRGPVQGKHEIGARLVRYGEARIDPQSVTVDLRVRGLFHLPDLRRCLRDRGGGHAWMLDGTHLNYKGLDGLTQLVVLYQKEGSQTGGNA